MLLGYRLASLQIQNVLIQQRLLYNHLGTLLQEAQKDGEVSEDESRSAQEQVQKMTDEYVTRVDEIVEHKEEEIMEV